MAVQDMYAILRHSIQVIPPWKREKVQQKWFPHAQRDIAGICVTYLSYKTFERSPCSANKEFEARLELNPLYDYAARYWGDHGRSSLGLTAWMDIKEPIMAFLQNEA